MKMVHVQLVEEAAMEKDDERLRSRATKATPHPAFRLRNAGGNALNDLAKDHHADHGSEDLEPEAAANCWH